MGQAVRTAMMFAALISIAGTGLRSQNRVTTVPVSLALSPVAMDFDEGIDVRDEFGRPVQSAVARQEFKQLFVSTVFTLLTRAELPQMAAVLAALDKTWDTFRFAFSHSMAPAWRFFVDLGMPSPRRSQAPPFFLLAAPSLSLGLMLFRISDNQQRTKAVLSCLSSIIIRC